MTAVSREEAATAAEREFAENPGMYRGRWLVLRHGGASSHRWRVQHTAGDCDRARAIYGRQAAALRQGGVALVTPLGAVDQIATAPRLRTRW